jgi:ferredoxin
MVPFKYGNPLKNKKLQFPQIDYGRCMFCGLCVDECPVECLKMGKRVTMAGWERKDIVKGPAETAVKRFSEKEVAELEAEAKRIAAEKAAAKKAAAKEGAAKKPAKEGAAAEGAAKPLKKKAAAGNNNKAAEAKAEAKPEAKPESKPETKPKEGGAS